MQETRADSPDLRKRMKSGPSGRCILNLNDVFYSEFPADVLELHQQLEELYLCHSGLTCIPQSITRLDNLKVLELKDNDFEEFPRQLCGLQNLEELDLSHNEIISDLPHELIQLIKLKRFALRDTTLEGVLNAHICDLETLQSLDISRNNLTSVPESMSKLTKLSHLDLSRNKFTVAPTVLEKLTNLEVLDISYNRLEKLSIDLSGLSKLKNLDLEENSLEVIPDKVCALLQLKRLDISRNNITDLPKCITSLENLEELWMEQNQFKEFPEVVCGLRNLSTLSLNGNTLHTVPQSISKLSKLKYLDVGSCSLSEMPLAVCMLKELRWLCLNNNRIKTLPSVITQLRELSFIYLKGNPLSIPPADVSKRGVKAIFNFINEADIKPTSHQKLLLIGNVKAGKTSLARTLIGGSCQLTSEDERTIVLDQRSWTPKKTLSIQVYDFGGNEWYDVVQHFFIDKHAIVLLVVNLVQYAAKEFGDCVGKWLQTLQARAPGATAYIVATHTDQCSTDEIESKKSSILDIMHAKELLEVNRVQQELHKLAAKQSDLQADLMSKRLKASLKNRLALPRKVFAVSSKSLENIDELRRELVQKAKTLGRVIPASWQQLHDGIHYSDLSKDKSFLTLEDVLAIDRIINIDQARKKSEKRRASHRLRSVSEGEVHADLTKSDPELLSSESGHDSSFVQTGKDSHQELARKSFVSKSTTRFGNNNSSQQNENDDFTTEDEAAVQKRRATRQLSASQVFSATERLDEILAFFHSIGDVLWYEGNPDIKRFVFHKQSFLIDLLKSIFSERLSEEVTAEKIAFIKQGFSLQSLLSAKRELLLRGTLSIQLLKGILDHLKLEENMIDAVVQLLIQFDLCFQVSTEQDGKKISRLQFPWFLKVSEPKEASEMLCNPPGDKHMTRFILEYVFPVSFPRILYENMAVRMHRLVRDKEGMKYWKNGVYARIRACKVLLHRQTADNVTISFRVEGFEILELWSLLTRLNEELLTVMDCWPGMTRESWLVCPHCTRMGIKDPHRFSGEFLEMECPNDEDFISCPNADAAGTIPIYMLYPITVSRDTPSTDELQDIANEMCENWKQLSRSLGLEDSALRQVDCKENDTPQEKAFQMLLKWTQVRGSKATRASLAKALVSKSVDREDLAEKVSGRMRRHAKGT